MRHFLIEIIHLKAIHVRGRMIVLRGKALLTTQTLQHRRLCTTSRKHRLEFLAAAVEDEEFGCLMARRALQADDSIQ